MNSNTRRSYGKHATLPRLYVYNNIYKRVIYELTNRGYYLFFNQPLRCQKIKFYPMKSLCIEHLQANNKHMYQSRAFVVASTTT